jgi:hypothetical protein
MTHSDREVPHFEERHRHRVLKKGTGEMKVAHLQNKVTRSLGTKAPGENRKALFPERMAPGEQKKTPGVSKVRHFRETKALVPFFLSTG